MTDSTMLGRNLREGAAVANRNNVPVTSDATSSTSAVAWGAIVAGAAGAAALSLILLLLGTGLGLSSVSLFSDRGTSATTFGVSTILWITFTQLAASGMGGYLAGRLRTRWIATHSDEVYFRDTAHGFLAWAIATLATAAMLGSAVGSIVGTGANAAAAVVGGVGTAAAAAAPAAAAPAATAAASAEKQGGAGNGYFVDSLFRKDAASPAAASAPSQGNSTPSPSDGATSSAEAGRIFAAGLESGSLPPDDVKYLGQVVSQRTGLSQGDAEKRVNDAFARMKAKADQAKAQAQEAAEKARKASAYAALWLFVSLLFGAFVASLAATFGGRQRDLV